MKSKSFLKLMLVIGVLLGTQMGLVTPEPALAALCCQTCESNYTSCRINCESGCSGNQSCLGVCYENCEAAYVRCYSSCVSCGGGGGMACCYDFSGYCAPECSSCYSC